MASKRVGLFVLCFAIMYGGYVMWCYVLWRCVTTCEDGDGSHVTGTDKPSMTPITVTSSLIVIIVIVVVIEVEVTGTTACG